MAVKKFSARYEALLTRWLDAQELYLIQAETAPVTNLPPTVTAPNGQKVDYNKFYEVSCAMIEKYKKLYEEACQKEGGDNPRMIHSQLTPRRGGRSW